MSALNFIAAGHVAIVVADTLGVSAKTGKASNFCTKVMVLPHLRMLVAALGSIDVATAWYAELQGHMVVPGVAAASMHAPAALQKIWRNYSATQMTSKIYHIGADEVSGDIRVFAFESAKDFQCEEKELPIRVISPSTIGISTTDAKSVEALLKIVIQQREEDLARPKLERLGIGGEVIATTIIGKDIMMKTVHRFEDYDDCYREAIESALRTSATAK
jgi:hypothetical protein